MHVMRLHRRWRKIDPSSFESPVELEFSTSLKIRFRSCLQANKNNTMTFGSKGLCCPTLGRRPPVHSATNDNQRIWTQHTQKSFDPISASLQVNARLESIQLHATNQIGQELFDKISRYWRLFKRQCIRHSDCSSYSNACSKIACQ